MWCPRENFQLLLKGPLTRPNRTHQVFCHPRSSSIIQAAKAQLCSEKGAVRDPLGEDLTPSQVLSAVTSLRNATARSHLECCTQLGIQIHKCS